MKQFLSIHFWTRRILLIHTLILISTSSFADDALYQKARTFQRDGKYDQAIGAFKDYLSRPVDADDIADHELATYTEALVQLMNTFQSKGAPEACIPALQEIYSLSPILKKQCLRDYFSVLGYALSRTEKMQEAEETTLKALALPLHQATPERYFRDYAYAAAVFYGNPDYQNEVIDWCEEAIQQAELCSNTSGKQWVTAMLGSAYKRQGRLNDALKLFHQSKEEALEKNDYLGVLNSLHALVDIFFYCNVPEYANIYASEAVRIENKINRKNPMVSAQTYINKGKALLELGQTDSVSYYISKARQFCESLPYNSGMVDIDLLEGIYLTNKGVDSMHLGMQKLLHVTREGTVINQAKAYHQLAQTYLVCGKGDLADIMLDNMYSLLSMGEFPMYISIDYDPIINHYLEHNNHSKVEQYTRLMLQEQQAFKEKKLNFNLAEAIIDHKTAQDREILQIALHKKNNRSLWLLISVVLSVMAISYVVSILLNQRKRHKIQMEQADEKMAVLVEKLNQSSAEKKMIVQEIDEMMNDKDNRQELETLTPSILQKYGESRFRQRFELLYPLFLPRLRERVPSISRREELLSMLIILKQDNKEIAELLAIAPRSVLMLRHRFRQKIGMAAENSLEDFIESMIRNQNNSSNQQL